MNNVADLTGRDVEVLIDDVVVGEYDSVSIDYNQAEVTREPMGTPFPNRTPGNITGSGTLGNVIFENPGKAFIDHLQNKTEFSVKLRKKGTTEEYECTKCHATSAALSGQGGDNVQTQEDSFTFENLVNYTPT